MATINKSKVTVINRGFTIFFIVICFLLSLIQSQEAYAEMKKISVTSKLLKTLIKTDETYPDQTRVRFTNNLQMFSSADPDWDKAKVFGVRYSINPTRDGDPYNGCLAITHHNGDQTFIKYEGSWKWALPKDGVSWISESKGKFTGGTGKFEGISGTVTIKVEGRGPNHYVSSKWEVEYEIASTNN
jgi:hypothetical protein